MTQREKLIELIHEFGFSGYEMIELADYLLDNGVVVLPCRCRDCEHARKLKENFYGWEFSCKHFNSHSVNSIDFCSYAKRKDGAKMEEVSE